MIVRLLRKFPWRIVRLRSPQTIHFEGPIVGSDAIRAAMQQGLIDGLRDATKNHGPWLKP